MISFLILAPIMLLPVIAVEVKNKNEKELRRASWTDKRTA
jgi:hypothetical protein